ncbi:hypothetical protein [Streptomyces aidingensis]|uniref:SH3 domain-containing protein n=1 Tax=Streptomyces aidingensis TaxID=910347 RepID=A0A1I1MI14_9ACTN|nr:hypothetical protein [Streptomyces aidingensis]SFC82313.1 hypothetical protein SAMN05421773_106168 [Streptomyces aidingensis]
MSSDLSREQTAELVRARLAEAEDSVVVPPDLWQRMRAGPVYPPRRRSWPRPAALAASLAAGLGAAVAVAAVAAGAWWLAGPRPGTAPAAAPETVPLTVYNAERACRPLRVIECSLHLAADPYGVYAEPGNHTGRVWHGDTVTARCVIGDGTLLTDESGVSSRRWYLVTTEDGTQGWLPGARTRNTVEVRLCTEDEIAAAAR